MAGHKGLYGPMGTGMLITPNGAGLETVIQGGTGTESALAEQPAGMPERLESGTQNMPGIAGLRAGIEFVGRRGPQAIARRETALLRRIYRGLSSLPGIVLYTPEPDLRHFAPVLSFNVAGLPSETAARGLNEQGVAVRAGLHCAPTAHRFMGTLETGAVRVCPSAFTTEADADGFLRAVKRLLRKNSGPKD
ncbi:MAG TPA: hypothetical protein DCL64_00675 [Ruminococcaceae bacterium]|nr:hypothetical protein [Oscillospiraceae bacterium]